MILGVFLFQGYLVLLALFLNRGRVEQFSAKMLTYLLEYITRTKLELFTKIPLGLDFQIQVFLNILYRQLNQNVMTKFDNIYVFRLVFWTSEQFVLWWRKMFSTHLDKEIPVDYRGQLIFKANFKVFIWTKKRTKIFLYFFPSL